MSIHTIPIYFIGFKLIIYYHVKIKFARTIFKFLQISKVNYNSSSVILPSELCTGIGSPKKVGSDFKILTSINAFT